MAKPVRPIRRLLGAEGWRKVVNSRHDVTDTAEYMSLHMLCDLLEGQEEIRRSLERREPEE